MSEFVQFFQNWQEVPAQQWRWRDFRPQELADRKTGELLVHLGALDALQALRNELGKPVIVTSGFRTERHNRAVGGATRSQHLFGKAFDVSMVNHDPLIFEQAARRHGFRGFGFYPEKNFMHIDLREKQAEWGQRWPQETPEYTEEMPFRSVASKSGRATARVAGSTAAGGAAAVQVAQKEGSTNLGMGEAVAAPSSELPNETSSVHDTPVPMPDESVASESVVPESVLPESALPEFLLDVIASQMENDLVVWLTQYADTLSVGLAVIAAIALVYVIREIWDDRKKSGSAPKKLITRKEFAAEPDAGPALGASWMASAWQPVRYPIKQKRRRSKR